MPKCITVWDAVESQEGHVLTQREQRVNSDAKSSSSSQPVNASAAFTGAQMSEVASEQEKARHVACQPYERIDLGRRRCELQQARERQRPDDDELLRLCIALQICMTNLGKMRMITSADRISAKHVEMSKCVACDSIVSARAATTQLAQEVEHTVPGSEQNLAKHAGDRRPQEWPQAGQLWEGGRAAAKCPEDQICGHRLGLLLSDALNDKHSTSDCGLSSPGEPRRHSGLASPGQRPSRLALSETPVSSGANRTEKLPQYRF